jgi:hypothetical protein
MSHRARFGIATFPDDVTNVTALLASADQALLEAKGTGEDVVKSAWRPPSSQGSQFTRFQRFGARTNLNFNLRQNGED